MVDNEPSPNDSTTHGQDPSVVDAEIVDVEFTPVAEYGPPPIRVTPAQVDAIVDQSTRSPASYQVPRRFGTAAILGFTTLMAIMFAAVRFFGGPWWIYMFLFSLVFTTAVSQMVFRMGPRISSVVSGSILLPVLVVIVFVVEAFSHSNLSRVDWLEMILLAVPMAMVGALVGYLAGALGAGVFLILDRLDSLFSRDDR